MGLYKAGARMFCIDIAHGHSVLMEDMIKWMRTKWGNEVFIMAGNVATGDGARDLAEWGVDMVKCGVGPGSVCTTRVVTGHGVPQVSAIQDCVEALGDFENVTLIADGGIRSSGDIVKSFVFGADYVMLGGLLAGANETPGEVIDTPHGNVKVYMGSASYDRKGVTKEGIRTTVPCKGPVKDVIESLVGGLRSGMSYSDARTLGDLYYAHYQKQTPASYAEGLPHMRK
jgi:IMP dehydrogenase